jgi:glycosyltransferase involved in cell wall biosynthesis
VTEVLRAAAARGLECVIYGDPGTRLPPASSTMRPVTLEAGWTQWWDQVVLPRALRRDGVDVFLSPYYKRPLRAPCPSVVTIHDLYFIDYPGRRRPVRDVALTALARVYARGAAAIIADSEHSRRAIVARLGLLRERVAVIPVGLGREFVAGTPSPAQRDRYGLGPRYVLYVGNFLPHKNLPTLLRAWAALPATHRDTHRLLLAGGDRGGQPVLASLARTLGIAASVSFSGLVADEDLPAVYGGAAALVLPSLEEGFGLPALEAMACGAPVIASTRGALPEVVGDAGVLVDPERTEALTAALTRVLSSESERAALRRRGFARAATFTAERTAGRVIDVLEAASGRQPALTGSAG